MIVLTSVTKSNRRVMPVDVFCFTVADCTGSEVLIQETITVTKNIDYIASFRFALEDGTCPGFHLMGIFANSEELPTEIKNAVLFEDLTVRQRIKFVNSLGIDMDGKYVKKEEELKSAFNLNDDDPTYAKYEDDHPKLLERKYTLWEKALIKLNNFFKAD